MNAPRYSRHRARLVSGLLALGCWSAAVLLFLVALLQRVSWWLMGVGP